jgi:hypothetical protein
MVDLGIVSAGSNVALLVGMNFSRKRPPCSKILVWKKLRKLNPPVDLVEGAEIEMTIRGDTLLYRNAMGGLGAIHLPVFMKGIPKM